MKASLEPTDFAQKYILDQQKNPYKTDTTSVDPKEALEEIKGQRAYIQSELKYLNSQLNDLSNGAVLKNAQTDMLVSTYEHQLAELDRQEGFIKGGQFAGAYNFVNQIGQQIGGSDPYATALKTVFDWVNQGSPTEGLSVDQQNILRAAATEMQIGGYAAPVKQPKLKLPSWLQSSIAGSPTSIKGLDWKEAITPSAQIVAGWNPTQQKIWGSYVKASGGNTSDLVSNMQNMLPRTLNLGKSWRNFSQ